MYSADSGWINCVESSNSLEFHTLEQVRIHFPVHAADPVYVLSLAKGGMDDNVKQECLVEGQIQNEPGFEEMVIMVFCKVKWTKLGFVCTDWISPGVLLILERLQTLLKLVLATGNTVRAIRALIVQPSEWE